MSFAYFPLYTGDYLRDTADLTVSEHGIYVLLLIYCWDSRGPVPLDEARAARIVGASSDDERNQVKFILSTYFVRHDDGWYNPRLDREIARCNAISGARSEAGKLGASRTWGKMANAKANAIASAKQMPRQVPLSPSPSPRKTKPSPSPAAPGFVKFWDTYPKGQRRVDKDGCLKFWIANNLEAKAEAIVAHLQAMKSDREWTKEEGQFIPKAKNYLSQSRFDSEVQTRSPAKRGPAYD